jgi:hypothetical protein
MITRSGRRGLSGLLLLALLVVAPGCVNRWAARSPTPAAGQPLPPSPRTPPAPVAGSRPAPPPTAATMPARLGPGASGGNGASSQCLAQIETFAEAQTGNRVILGQAAFADGDQLVLTRLPRRGSDRTPMDGRAAAESPVVLNLVTGSQGCSVNLAAAPPADPAQVVARRSSEGTGQAGPPVQSPDASPAAPLPACTCVPLPK